MTSPLPVNATTATTGKLMTPIFWIVIAIDSIALALVLLGILSDSFTNAAPEVGGRLLAFLLLPLALGIPVCLFVFGNDIVAHRLALLIALAPVPCVIAYGLYQDYSSAREAVSGDKMSVDAAADARPPMADSGKKSADTETKN